MLTKGAIIEFQRLEQRPVGHDQTLASDAFKQLGCVLGCGAPGLSCSAQPQLPSVHVELPVNCGGNQC